MSAVSWTQCLVALGFGHAHDKKHVRLSGKDFFVKDGSVCCNSLQSKSVALNTPSPPESFASHCQ